MTTKAATLPAGPSDTGAATLSDGPGGAYVDSGERRPSAPRESKETKAEKPGGILGRMRKPPAEGTPKTSSGERRPVVAKHRRVPTSDFWGSFVEAGAGIVGRTDYVPMARAMAWSSPVAGDIIEGATKDTVVDKLAQPLCRNAEKWADLFDLIGFWAAIGMAQANPAQQGAAMSFARKRLVSLLPRIATNIKKQRAQEKAAVEALIEVMPDLQEMFPDAPPGSDPVDLLLSMLFAAPAPEGVPV